LNEKRTVKIISKLLGQIHRFPRRPMNKLSAQDAEDLVASVDALDRNDEMKRAIDAKALDRMPAADDLRKNYANNETDLTKAMTQVHDKPHRIAGYRRAETGTSLGPIMKGTLDPNIAKVIKSRFDSEK
jgi:hypothetical protein